MSAMTDWEVPPSVQPQIDDYPFDLDAALASVVSVRALAPSDAFTVETLGEERLGSGVLIPGGLVLTIGYLIVEAQTIWITFSDGTAVQGHTIGYDQQTGFALLQPLSRVTLPVLEFGDSSLAKADDRVVIGGLGGRERSIAAHIVARQEFAGYWEYVLENAIFSAPAHPQWGGAPLLNAKGELIGIGSLQLQAASNEGDELPLNMSVPVDLLMPIMDELKKFGRASRPVRPWLGLYSADMEGEVVVLGVARGGPAERADIDAGDVILSVAGEDVLDLADFYRKVWQLGAAGVEVPVTLMREEGPVNLIIKSGDRDHLLKSPSLH